MKTATHGNVIIAYRDEGKGHPILCLPSLGRGAADFDAVTHHLVAGGLRVLRPEPRGAEGSTGPLKHLTMHDLAADAACVLEKAETGPAIVVGHAFGNFVARMLATDRPDLVRALVLAAASPGKAPPWSHGQAIPPDVANAIQQSGDPKLSDEVRLKALQVAFFAPGNDARVWLKGWHPEAMAAQGNAQTIGAIDELFLGGHAPTLIVSADHDVVAPPDQEAFLADAMAPRAKLVTVAGAGHALLPEQPKAVADAIAAFAKAPDMPKQPNIPRHRHPKNGRPAAALVAAAQRIRQAALLLPTDDHVEGPFYRPCPPSTHDLYPADCHGPILHFTGSVRCTTGKALPGTLIEIWGADDRGHYDNSDPHTAPAPDFFRCRAKLRTDAEGLFKIRTVLPANYPVTPTWMRVKHLHFKLFGPCMIGLTTEIELLPDDYTAQDQLYNPNLAVNLDPLPDEHGKKAFQTHFDFVLTPIEQPGYLLAASRHVM